jgi:hypothetical protein
VSKEVPISYHGVDLALENVEVALNAEDFDTPDDGTYQYATVFFGTATLRNGTILKAAKLVLPGGGDAYVGTGETKIAALEAAFRAAFPKLKRVEYAPGAAWSSDLADD